MSSASELLVFDGRVVAITALDTALMYSIAFAIAIASIVAKAEFPVIWSAPCKLQALKLLADLFALTFSTLCFALCSVRLAAALGVESLKFVLLEPIWL